MEISGIAALAAMAFATLAFLLCEVYSLDVWWQIAIGRDIFESGSIPRVDRYSVAGLERPYHDSHWLFQIVMASAHRLLGWPGVQLAVLAAWAGVLALCYRSTRRWLPATPAAALVFLAAMSSVERFLPRPELGTLLGIAAFYFLLQERRYRTLRHLGVLALIQVAWTNGHGLFVIGPFLVGCYLLGAVARRGRDEAAALARALSVVLLATLVNPFFLGAWRYAALLVFEAGTGGPDVFQRLGELSSTFGPGFRSSPAFWFFAALLAASAVAAAGELARGRLRPRLLIVAALAASALAGRRNVVLFALVAAPFLGEALGRFLPRLDRFRRPAAWAVAGLALLYSVYPLSGAYYLKMGIPARSGWGVTPSFFPHGLPAFLDRIGFAGPVLNSNTLGGFHLFHRYPSSLPLTDGRWEVYEGERLAWILQTSRHPTAWRRTADEYGVRAILLAHTSPEAQAILPGLSRAPDWRLVYYDQAASFWLPAADPASPATQTPDPADPPLPSRLDDVLILDGFLAGVGALEPRLANLERGLDFGRRRPLLLERIGGLQLQLGRFDAAEESFRELLREDPEHLGALNELAFLAYRRGDPARAAELMRRALAISPDDADLRENLRRVEEALEQLERGHGR